MIAEAHLHLRQNTKREVRARTYQIHAIRIRTWFVLVRIYEIPGNGRGIMYKQAVSIVVLQLSCVLPGTSLVVLLFYRGISSTPELFSLSCDRGLHCIVAMS